ncbi:hypothetical protein [Paracoccus sp. DMF]|uniref:hypothetical protein n=1 Tax=Paracoccus sp. DMF TaxID=400837 RepID=UPI0007811550|nr:hypothetical protein [Paracoccus sp. DMF]MCV2447541.1 hypothetical protein [Paracoccus sp. DMF]
MADASSGGPRSDLGRTITWAVRSGLGIEVMSGPVIVRARQALNDETLVIGLDQCLDAALSRPDEG